MPTFCLNFLAKRPQRKVSKLRGGSILSWKVRHRRLETEWKWCIVGLGASLTEGGSLQVVSGQTGPSSHTGEVFVHTTFMSLMKALRLLLKHFQVLSPENPLMSYGTEALICQAWGFQMPACFVVVTVELTMTLCEARRLGNVGRWSNSSICIYPKNISWFWVNMKKFMNNPHYDQPLYLGYSRTLMFNSHLLGSPRFQDIH